MERVRTCVLFGGTGWVGTHVALHLLREGLAETIVLVDLCPPSTELHAALLHAAILSGDALFRRWDLHHPIPLALSPQPPDLLIHCMGTVDGQDTSPLGPFITCVRAAQHICGAAEAWGCPRVVATRYGSRGESGPALRHAPWDSRSLAQDAAARVYRNWQARSATRRLLEIHTGMVFGPGDRDEVAHIVRRAIRGGLISTRRIAKLAHGMYVKELGWMVQLGLEYQNRDRNPVLIMEPPDLPESTVERCITALQRVAGRDHAVWPPVRSLGKLFAESLATLAPLAGRGPKAGIALRPVESSDQMSQSNVSGHLSYSRRCSIEQAFQDWQREQPELFAGYRTIRKVVPLRIVPESSASEQSPI